MSDLLYDKVKDKINSVLALTQVDISLGIRRNRVNALVRAAYNMGYQDGAEWKPKRRL